MEATSWLLLENLVLILLIAGFALGGAKHSRDINRKLDEIVHQLERLNEKQEQ